MKRQKRDLSQRAYKKGYQAGISGRSKNLCPSALEKQESWLSGWRDGRADNWDGFTGVSGIHRIPGLMS